MATTAKIVLDKRRETKNGFPISIIVRNKSKRYVNLGEYSALQHWNGYLLPTHPEYRRLKSKLEKRERELVEEVAYCNDLKLDLKQSIEVIKNGLQNNKDLEIFLLKQKISQLQKTTGVGMLEFYTTRINELDSIGRSSAAYKQARHVFKDYLQGNDINLNTIDYDFLNSFIQYKYQTGCGVPGVRFYLKNLSALYEEAKKRPSLSVMEKNPIKSAIPPKPPKKEILLPDNNDLKSIFEYVPPKGTTNANAFKLHRTLAIFKFQLLIGGHDLIDIALLDHKNLHKGRIRFNRYKNRNKRSSVLIDNYLNDSANEIISSYGSSEGRIFDFIPNPLEDIDKYNAYRRNIHRTLTTISHNLNLNCAIKTKTPRFLFRSRAGELMIDSFIIMQLQGHKPKGVTFDYQARIPNNIIDPVHKKILGSYELKC